LKDVKGEWPPERIASSFFHDADIVITEGYKKGPFPKIEVIRKANKKKPVCLKNKGLIAIATDTTLKAVSVPVYPLDGHKPIAGLIEKMFLKQKSGVGLTLVADGKVVALKPFIDAMLKEAVIGMVKSLKHCSKAREIEIRVKR
ncbi:MAG: molybdopterin-guanine dinucleotide biosynthesis protein MobB, partial [Deltaproteobacteria bacterium]